jgi:23S rRNA pseudouridine1911/1915/1917 synthase
MSFVLNKSSGLPCFPLHGDPESDSMLRRLYDEHPRHAELNWPEGFAGGLAHRLDIPTSGQLVVANSLAELGYLRGLFTHKKLLKSYLFLSSKTVSWTHNTASAAIAHDRSHKKRMVVQRGKSTPHRGKWLPAQTTFRLLGSQDGLSLWRAEMRSGVMHQIRLHAAFAGIALAGDSLYGGGAAPDFFPSTFALHHLGMQGDSLDLEQLPCPDWWPHWTGMG